MAKPFVYQCTLDRVVDGDTIDVNIDLGFKIILAKQRVRLVGIDTPESRTRDLEEKKFGLAAKARVKQLLGKTCVLKTQINKSGEDMKGKFGRILGDFNVYDSDTDSWKLLTSILISEGHAVPYHGQNKDDVQKAHLANRVKLLEDGVVL